MRNPIPGKLILPSLDRKIRFSIRKTARSCSVKPPQIPQGSCFNEYSRHSCLHLHPEQISFACCIFLRASRNSSFFSPLIIGYHQSTGYPLHAPFSGATSVFAILPPTLTVDVPQSYGLQSQIETLLRVEFLIFHSHLSRQHQQTQSVCAFVKQVLHARCGFLIHLPRNVLQQILFVVESQVHACCSLVVRNANTKHMQVSVRVMRVVFFQRDHTKENGDIQYAPTNQLF